MYPECAQMHPHTLRCTLLREKIVDIIFSISCAPREQRVKKKKKKRVKYARKKARMGWRGRGVKLKVFIIIIIITIIYNFGNDTINVLYEKVNLISVLRVGYTPIKENDKCASSTPIGDY